MSDPASSGTVLYVEDEESDTLFMQVAFRKAGLASSLRTVGDGREAISYLSGQAAYTNRDQYPVPAVVLLDLNLPIVSGFEVLEWMRRRASFKALPVVVFSSSMRDEDKQKALALGANEFVSKPNSALLFLKVVKKLQERFLAPAGEKSY